VASEPAHAPVRRPGGDFWRFWVGQTISNLGSSFTMFALPLLVFKLTGSPLNLGLIMTFEFLPYLLFGLILGAWVDRVDRRRMMIATDVARAVVIASIVVLAGLDMLAVWWIYAVGFVSSTLKICFDAGEFAAIPSLVGTDDLIKANGHIQASYSAALFFGPLMAGALLAVARYKRSCSSTRSRSWPRPSRWRSSGAPSTPRAARSRRSRACARTSWRGCATYFRIPSSATSRS
jgi:MFS family permease